MSASSPMLCYKNTRNDSIRCMSGLPAWKCGSYSVLPSSTNRVGSASSWNASSSKSSLSLFGGALRAAWMAPSNAPYYTCRRASCSTLVSSLLALLLSLFSSCEINEYNSSSSSSSSSSCSFSFYSLSWWSCTLLPWLFTCPTRCLFYCISLPRLLCVLLKADFLSCFLFARLAMSFTFTGAGRDLLDVGGRGFRIIVSFPWILLLLLLLILLLTLLLLSFTFSFSLEFKWLTLFWIFLLLLLFCSFIFALGSSLLLFINVAYLIRSLFLAAAWRISQKAILRA